MTSEKICGVVVSTAKHTPGPWHADWSRNREVNDSIRTTDQNIIAWVEPNDFGVEAAQANARLIAAAPDLLAALRAVESRLDRWASQGIARGPSGKDADWPTLLTQVHDALRRAEGRPT